MSTKTARLMYAGYLASGRTTSMTSVLMREAPNHPYLKHQHRIGSIGFVPEIAWVRKGAERKVSIARLDFYQSQYARSLAELDRHPYVDFQLEYIRSLDGLIFIVDASRKFSEITVDTWMRIHWIFEEIGRPLESFPVIVQINHWDSMDRNTEDEIRSMLCLKHSTPTIRSIATQHVGTSETIDALLRLIPGA